VPLHPPDTVRLLTPADAVAYTVLRREMLADAPWAFLRSPEDDPGCNATGLATSLARPAGYAIAGAFAHDQPQPRLVAVAGVHRAEPLKAAHRATIFGVYVSPANRGTGLGRAVVAAAIEAARSWPAAPPIPKVDLVTLSVSERSSTAQQLYLKMGFKPWGTEPDAVRIPGHPRGYAETHMQLKL
jgi:RimJ/RimL family protein N-acetyltransferase